jgi:tRNA A58 N-methylase Trm61
MKNIQKQNNQNINLEYPSFLTSAIEQVEKTKKEVEEAIITNIPTIEILKENKIFLDRFFKKEEPVMLTKYINPEREILNEARENKRID